MSSSIRIAQVCPTYYPYYGGIETYVRHISEKLALRGLNVEVLTTDPSGSLPVQEVLNGVLVKRFSCIAPGEAYYYSGGLKTYLAKHSAEYDVVHVHSYHAFPALLAAWTKSKNKLVFSPHYHGTGHTICRSILHVPYRYVARVIFRKSDAVVCASRSEEALLERDFPVVIGKTRVIQHGLDVGRSSPPRESHDGKVILYVGRLEHYKGVQYLLRAMPRMPWVSRLEIVGVGPYERTLVKLAEELGIGKRVIFLGNVSHSRLKALYRNADAFSLLSAHEAFGLTVMEALAEGTPVVVSRASALVEWIDNKSCFGIDFPIQVDELAELLSKASSSRASGLAFPSWDEAASKLCEVYSSVVASRSRGPESGGIV